MERLAGFIVEKRTRFLAVFAMLSVLSLFSMGEVRVNYDHTKYLPQDMPTSKGIALARSEFGLHGMAQVMAGGLTIPEAIRLKAEIERIPGVKNVLWLDDFVDIAVPLSFFDVDLVERYYKHQNALFQVVFAESDHSQLTNEAMEKLERLDGGTLLMRGPAVDASRMRRTATAEVFAITLLVVPIFFSILLLSTTSWIEPVLFVAAIGVSILVNMGTNVFLGEISYITQVSSGLLQFAVTMDYAIFLLHRFGEERTQGLDPKRAMVSALKLSFPAISASSLTTVAGFMALMFMRYGIGLDMGLVLAKGVVLSFITVMTLLPALVILFEKTIERTHHRSFMPDLSRVAGGILRLGLVLPVVGILLPVAFMAQGANDFLYGGGAVADPAVASETAAIYDVFGNFNPLVLMVPAGDVQREARLASQLEELEAVSVESLFTFAHVALPRESLPARLVESYQGDHYSRMFLHLDTPVESSQAFVALGKIRELAGAHYPGRYYLVGSTSAIADIREVVERDFVTINYLAILAVGLIVLVTFRSLAIPVMLVLVIQAAIWLNMAIPYFTGSPLIFIGYMIVSAVQLGATIDYAILLAGRYLARRRSAGRRDAAISAICDSGHSIITSAAIMSAAGFTLGYMSSIPGIAALGILVGRGALLSCVLVLTFLPHLLVAGDRLIRYTTLGQGFSR
jgi:predicted RND superfamily exporter protein